MYIFFYSFWRRISKSIINEFYYNKIISRKNRVHVGDKIVFADVSNLVLNRYLYAFLKFFQIMGYTVYIPKNRDIVEVLRKKNGEFAYASWLLEEDFLKFGKPPRDKVEIWLTAEQLSNDYFSESFGTPYHGEIFHVPICEYPFLYYADCWDLEVNLAKKRKRAIFMMGNCDSRYYHQISHSPFFNIPSRSETAAYLYEQEYFLDITSDKNLEDYINQGPNCRAILIDTSTKFQLGGEKLKKTLMNFDFYLALPGVQIPYSHNIAEGMSMGCIPVLHTSYAELMSPKLINGQNAFTFEDLKHLNSLIRELFLLEEKILEKMRLEVVGYYNKYLRPRAVVEKIERNRFDKIFIQAEGISLNYLKQDL